MSGENCRRYTDTTIFITEVSIECIQRELSNFEGPSHLPKNHVKVKEVEEDSGWEPPLWKQQYENIRTMRSKRDAPVDKYGCFMNAEKEVAPEVGCQRCTVWGPWAVLLAMCLNYRCGGINY